MCEKAS